MPGTPLDVGTVIGAFAGGMGDGGNIVDAEHFRGLDLRCRQENVTANVSAAADPKNIGGKHYRDRHEEKVIDLLRVKKRKDSFSTRHRLDARFVDGSIGLCEQVYRH